MSHRAVRRDRFNLLYRRRVSSSQNLAIELLRCWIRGGIQFIRERVAQILILAQRAMPLTRMRVRVHEPDCSLFVGEVG